MRQWSSWTDLSCAGILVIALSGCHDPYGTAPVSGTITCDGEPILEGRILFYPQSQSDVPNDNPGKRAEGLIKDGEYEMRTFGKPGDNDGAIIGPHRVAVFEPEINVGSFDPDEEDEDEEYGAFEPLCGGKKIGDVVVENKTNVINFALKSE